MSFKACPGCRYVWEDREEFLSDPDVEVVGYQVNYDDPNAGLILFTHQTPACGTTLALEVREFSDLYRGPICEDLLENTDECPGHCRDMSSLERCAKECNCTFARDILQILRDWPKRDNRERQRCPTAPSEI
jgi:hypothetical protein